MPKHDLENHNMLCVQGKSKMDTLHPAVSFFCYREFLQGVWMQNYGSIYYLVPGGLALFHSVNSFRLILQPCYSELSACTPLCTAISVYAAVEGLAMLLSWPASRTELLLLAWRVHAGRIRPPNKKTPTNCMGDHCKSPSWRFAATSKYYCVSGGSHCLHKGVSWIGIFINGDFHQWGFLIPNRIISPPNRRTGRLCLLPPALFQSPQRCPQAYAAGESQQSAGDGRGGRTRARVRAPPPAFPAALCRPPARLLLLGRSVFCCC